MTTADRHPLHAAATVLSVSKSAGHHFGKMQSDSITLIEGLGVEGDAHAGTTVQHLSRKARDPEAPNLRQVHLIQSELFDEVAADGFTVSPGQLGENITTSGIDLLALPTGTRLRFGAGATIEVTGLRNPCRQINGLAPGLMKRLIQTGPQGEVLRLAGIMSIVVVGGVVRVGDAIHVDVPAERRSLQPV